MISFGVKVGQLGIRQSNASPNGKGAEAGAQILHCFVEQLFPGNFLLFWIKRELPVRLKNQVTGFDSETADRQFSDMMAAIELHSSSQKFIGTAAGER